MIYSKNYDYITLVKYISFANKTILPMLLISRVKILYKQYQCNDLGKNIEIDITKTDYINDDITLEWFQHFINYIKNERRDI